MIIPKNKVHIIKTALSKELFRLRLEVELNDEAQEILR